MAKATVEKPAGLKCPKCRALRSLEEVFDHCGVSWPNQRWLSFRCPRCRRYWHVQLSGSRVEIGDIDGAPGPSFIPDNGTTRAGLRVTRSDAGISVRLGRRRWSFEARR